MARIDYRRIYSSIHGTIPTDLDGRSFDIHHIDYDHTNNNPSNLIAVSIQEHYNIHYTNGDYGACARIAARLNMQPAEISILVSKQQQKRVAEGSHHFLGGKIQQAKNKRLVDEGTHNFLGGVESRKITQERLENGTHHFLGGALQRTSAAISIANGTHNFVKDNPTYKRITDKTHHFLHNNPGKIQMQCPQCGKVGRGLANMARWHFDNCKAKLA